jgi:hypothetical protein
VISFLRFKRIYLSKRGKTLVSSKDSKNLRRRKKSLTMNLPKTRRISLVSKAQVVLFKTLMMSYKRLIKILKLNLMLFGQAHPKLPKLPLAMDVKDIIMLILMPFVLKVNIPMLSKSL